MTIKKTILLLAVAAAGLLASGCDSIRNYSVRSYQGPLPLTEYRYLETPPPSLPAPQP
jgi:hypothetical protein